MTRRDLLTVAAGATLAVLGLGVGQCRARDAGEREGALRTELKRLRADSARLATKADSLRVVYVTDTQTVTRWRTTYVTLRDSALAALPVASDSPDSGASSPDTGTVIRRAFAACDATIAAGRRALTTCESRLAVADSQLAVSLNAAKLWRELAASRQCRLLRVAPCPSRTVSAIGGAVLGAVAVGALRR